MTTTATTYKRSQFSKQQPLRKRLPVAGGAVTTILKGEICELVAGVWQPIAGDVVFAAELAICDVEITAVHLAGFYDFVIPRPGDLFEYAITPNAAFPLGDRVGFSTSTLLSTGAANPFASIVEHSGIPQHQGDATVGDVADRGNTILQPETGLALVSFDESASAYRLWNAET